jgi:hypothetical protein
VAPAVDAGACCWTRDWVVNPAVVTATAAGSLFAVSDIHGGYVRAVTLFTNAGLVQVSSPGVVTWTGGNATLVVNGDSIDKGDRSIDTLDLLQAMQAAAPALSGRVIVLLGNHEAEFLADPENSKADALRTEIAARSLTPEQFASSTTQWGRFLRSMPIAAVVSGWYFSHAGDSGGETVEQLSAGFRTAVDAANWGADVLIGSASPLESRSWWSISTLNTNLAALGAKHGVMGHDPKAFGEKGIVNAHLQGRLFRIDTGMSPAVDYSEGSLLRVDAPGSDQEQAFAVDSAGGATALDLTAN